MRRAPVILALFFLGISACGGFLGLSEDDDDPPNPQSSEGGTGATTGEGSVEGSETGPNNNDPGDGASGDGPKTNPDGQATACRDQGAACTPDIQCCAKSTSGLSLGCLQSMCKACVVKLTDECDAITGPPCCPGLVCELPMPGPGKKRCCINNGITPCKESGECCNGGTCTAMRCQF